MTEDHGLPDEMPLVILHMADEMLKAGAEELARCLKDKMDSDETVARVYIVMEIIRVALEQHWPQTDGKLLN